jgi:hypothetical protein
VIVPGESMVFGITVPPTLLATADEAGVRLKAA